MKRKVITVVLPNGESVLGKFFIYKPEHPDYSRNDKVLKGKLIIEIPEKEVTITSNKLERELKYVKEEYGGESWNDRFDVLCKRLGL